MAEILGISRTVIAMAELGERELSSNNMIKLRKLKMRSLQNPALVFDELEDKVRLEKENFREKLKLQIQNTEKSLAKAERMLATVSSKYTAAVEVLKLIESERRVFDGVADYTSRLDEQFEEQKKIYLTSHPSCRQPLEWKIQQLRMELDACQQKWNEINL